MISTLEMPSASALKLGIIRCLKTGILARSISAISGVNLPSNNAYVLAASIRYCEALGPAPQDIKFLILSGVDFEFGLVLFTIFTAW